MSPFPVTTSQQSSLCSNVSLPNNYFTAIVSQGGRCVDAMTEVPLAKGLFFSAVVCTDSYRYHKPLTKTVDENTNRG